VQLCVKNIFSFILVGIKQKIRKPSGGNQGAFSNQKPLTIKPYPMKIRGEYRRYDSNKI